LGDRGDVQRQLSVRHRVEQARGVGAVPLRGRDVARERAREREHARGLGDQRRVAQRTRSPGRRSRRSPSRAGRGAR
jgi:hypothetical protein